MPDVPVYLTLYAVATALDCHHMAVRRAWDYGVIRPVAYLGDRPCFDDTAVEALRRRRAAKKEAPNA